MFRPTSEIPQVDTWIWILAWLHQSQRTPRIVRRGGTQAWHASAPVSGWGQRWPKALSPAEEGSKGSLVRIYATESLALVTAARQEESGGSLVR